MWFQEASGGEASGISDNKSRNIDIAILLARKTRAIGYETPYQSQDFEEAWIILLELLFCEVVNLEKIHSQNRSAGPTSCRGGRSNQRC